MRQGALGAENLQVQTEHTRGGGPVARCLPAPEGPTPGDTLPQGLPLWPVDCGTSCLTWRPPKPFLHRVQTCLCWLRLTQQPGPMRKYPEQGSCFRGTINVCAINDRLYMNKSCVCTPSRTKVLSVIPRGQKLASGETSRPRTAPFLCQGRMLPGPLRNSPEICLCTFIYICLCIFGLPRWPLWYRTHLPMQGT